jgi:hypothetical protein
LIKRAVLVVVVLIGLWAGWRWLFPGDEAQIRAVLERIAEGVGGGGEGGGGVEALARAASLRNEFAPDVIVNAGPPFQRINGREAIIGAAARLNSATRNLELRFPDATVDVAADRQTATAVVTAEARFDQPGGGRGLDARELEVTFRRLDDRWVISAVTLIEPLKRLQ